MTRLFGCQLERLRLRPVRLDEGDRFGALIWGEDSTARRGSSTVTLVDPLKEMLVPWPVTVGGVTSAGG